MPSVSHLKSLRTKSLCCSPEAAWAWVNCIAEMAVHGDDDARRALPQAAQHYLDALAAERVAS